MKVYQGLRSFHKFFFRYLKFCILLSVCSGCVEEADIKEEDYKGIDKSNFDQFPDFDSILTSHSSAGDLHTPPTVLAKNKPLKREKSRVQFFIENEPSRDNTNRMTDQHRKEDSPSESCKSEYSGTDLRKFFPVIYFFFSLMSREFPQLKPMLSTSTHL